MWQMIARGTSEDNPDHLTSYPIIDMGNTLTTTKSARSMQGFTPRGLHLPADATEHSGSSDLIAINSIGHRIDPYLKDYTEKDKREYASNYAGQGICSYYGLLGECHRRSCTFRHYDVSPSAKRFMRVVMRRRGCTIGGRCRLPDCIYGHTCPVPKCKGLADCERPVWMHDQSRDIVKRVLPDTTATMLGDGTLRKLTAARKVSSDSASLPDMERRQKRLSDLAPPSQASGDDTLDETAAVQQWRARLEQRSQQASEPGTERATLENEEGGYHKAQPAPASQNAVTYTPSAPQTDASDDSIEPHTPSTTTRDRVLVKVTENGVPSQAQDAGVLEAFESEGVKGSDFGHVEDLIVFEGDF